MAGPFGAGSQDGEQVSRGVDGAVRTGGRPASTAAVADPEQPQRPVDVAWRSYRATIRMRGAPMSPCSSTSQPAFASTECRAAAKATLFPA